jgi:hypothetical protein
MALPDKIKITRGTTLVFSNSGEYSPTDAGQPTGTAADIDLQSLGTSGAARQSAKMDLGSATLDVEYEMTAYIEWHSAPTAGGSVDFYVGFSTSATAGDGNPGNLSGTDAAWQGYGADTASGTEVLPQLQYVGSLVAAADADIQVGTVGVFRARARYMMLVVVNNSSVALCNTDAIETGVAVTPLIYSIED